MADQRRQLRIATCQFAENYDPSHNARAVCRYVARARQLGADVVHFHECALSGYGARKDAKIHIASPDYDWPALRQAMRTVMAAAREYRIWVIVGGSHPLTPPHKPHNSLYLISPQGQIVDRYDKRFCMRDELKVYAPGDHFVIFTLKGFRCALLICYDLRFPELYRELYSKHVQVVFQSFHNGYMPRPTVHQHIMRQTMQAHAACNAMWVSMPNSAAYYSSWPSAFIRPDGVIAGQLKRNRPGLMVNTVDSGLNLYTAGSDFADLAVRGRLSNGKPVRDPRSRDRRCI